MRFFNEGTLNEWVRAHPSARAGLTAWKRIVDKAAWKTPSDLLAGMTADIVSVRKEAEVNTQDLRVIFDISGNRFRLAAHVNLARGNVFLKWFGTHAEYDKVDFKTARFE